jgi:hypothetical protein
MEDISQLVAKLKSLGMAKPDSIGWGDWVGPKKLSHRHHLMATLLAHGVTQGEIARELGMTPCRVSLIANTTRMTETVTALREKYYGTDPVKRFQRILPKAIDIAEGILDNPNNTPDLRFRVATEFMNRSLGKPKESMEVKTTSIRDLFSALDQLKKRNLEYVPKERALSSSENVLVEVSVVDDSLSSGNSSDEIRHYFKENLK